MAFTKVRNISIFRKVAMGLWESAGDPSVYGFLEIDVTHVKSMTSPTPLVIKAFSELMKNHESLNFVMRFGKLFRRKSINISVMVNINEDGTHDLSFATL